MKFIQPLLNWYQHNARDLPWRKTKDPYAIWVSEIMLQQTRVVAVIPYYQRFLATLPDVGALAAVEDDVLHKLWEGLGYYSRARNLKGAAIQVMDKFGGQVPTTYDALLTLPGIGEYTAGAVASIAGGQGVPAVDGNVLRVWARLNNDPADVAQQTTKAAFREAIANILPKDCPGQFNAAMMELGAVVCVPNGPPRCEECPIQAHCQGFAKGTAPLLPNKTGKRPRRIEEKTVFCLSSDGRYAGYRRGDKGLLAGLWQLPDVPGVLDTAQAMEQLSIWGLRPLGEVQSYFRKHVFTHVEWHMRVYAVAVAASQLPQGWRWLDESCALPTAYRVCL